MNLINVIPIEYKLDVTSNRIDLLIVGDAYIISLENKIRANLTNDLKDYARTINGVNKKVRKKIRKTC